MFKVLGGIGRSVPLYNGKARILVKAIIPAAPKCLAEMQSICEANGWKSVLDERGNLVVLSVVSIDAYRLSDSTLMTAYLNHPSIGLSTLSRKQTNTNMNRLSRGRESRLYSKSSTCRRTPIPTQSFLNGLRIPLTRGQKRNRYGM